jgi:hypothetical protein
MGKHGDKEDPKKKEEYQPRHAGGQDGNEWASATADTVELPKADKEKKK